MSVQRCLARVASMRAQCADAGWRSRVNVRKLLTADGVIISATFYGEELLPQQRKGAVLVASAIGVAQRFYTDFASWLSRQGYLVVTFDYRGIGRSRPEHLRGFQADVLSWAKLDCAAVLDAVSAECGGGPVYWIGHSLGGQIVALVPGAERITRVLIAGSGTGYWRENAAAFRPRALMLWYLVAPVSTAVCGYFPGKRLRVIGDLPAGVVQQWRRWCLNPQYLLSEGDWVRERFAAFSAPITFLSVTDDEYMSERSIESLASWYSCAPKTLRRFSPQDLGVPGIGHFGFFRARFERLLWQDEMLPLLSPAAASR